MSTMSKDETYNEASEPRSNGHMNDESFNGYANRETWAFNLHWQNDEGLYRSVLEYAQTLMDDEMSEPDAEMSLSYLGENVVLSLKELLEEAAGEGGEGARLVLDEVGSWWRIDYREVGEAVREALEAESD